MRTIPLSQIIIPENRQRQEFEAQAMQDLAESLEKLGLMHAPVLRQAGDGFFLVAGERRLKAITDIYALGGRIRFNGDLVPEGEVPYVTMGELSVLEAEEAELDENLKRKDLTWQEHAGALKRLHELRGAQKVAATPEGETPKVQTVAETALEISGRSDGYYQDAVRKELIVAKHLERPEIAKAKNVEEAFKILKRSEASEANRVLAAEVGKTFTAEMHTALNIDCLLWMTFPENQGVFDVILTDPPYGMDAQDFGDADGKRVGVEHRYDDSPEAWRGLLSKWAQLAFNVTKPQAHAYVFCDLDRFHELKSFMQAAGWYVFRTPLIDYKTDSGRVPLPDRGPRRQYELILYAIKGNKTVNHIVGDVIPCQADPNMTHGAQKPVALYVNLLKRSVRPGDQVLDTFSGSGTIFESCHQMQCKATGLELNPEYFGMGLRRLKAMQEIADPLSGLLDLN